MEVLRCCGLEDRIEFLEQGNMHLLRRRLLNKQFLSGRHEVMLLQDQKHRLLLVGLQVFLVERIGIIDHALLQGL